VVTSEKIGQIRDTKENLPVDKGKKLNIIKSTLVQIRDTKPVF